MAIQVIKFTEWDHSASGIIGDSKSVEIAKAYGRPMRFEPLRFPELTESMASEVCGCAEPAAHAWKRVALRPPLFRHETAIVVAELWSRLSDRIRLPWSRHRIALGMEVQPQNPSLDWLMRAEYILT